MLPFASILTGLKTDPGAFRFCQIEPIFASFSSQQDPTDTRAKKRQGCRHRQALPPHLTAASLPRLAMFFLLAFTKSAPRQGDKGRQRSGRLRSSSPLVIRGRAGTIEKQKNKLPRPLWTACGRSELRKKLEPSCLPTTLAAVLGWREHGAGSPQAKKKRAEARAQRH